MQKRKKCDAFLISYLPFLNFPCKTYCLLNSAIGSIASVQKGMPRGLILPLIVLNLETPCFVTIMKGDYSKHGSKRNSSLALG